MAINYMHRNHVVHRDIKPENVIFQNEKDLKVKLVDFGCAQKFVTGHMMLQSYGAPYYMAPEMIKGCYNEKVDLWSVGVIMYMLCTSEIPFDGQTDAEILQKIVDFKVFSFQ
jgi:serine/threonine protein kinase